MRLWFFLLLWVGCLCGKAQQRPFVLLEWNVENLFDTKDDEEKADEDFTPQGAYHWTPYRYWQKLNDIARVVAASTRGAYPPTLIGLCEVENDSVMRDLTQRSVLREVGYRYLMTNSPDERGIDVALLYEPMQFKPLEMRCIRIPNAQYGYKPTRDILYVRGLTLHGELSVFVVHLPSKTGGRKGDKLRKLAKEILFATTDSIMTADPEARLVVMGDFNEEKIKGCSKQLLEKRLKRGTGTYCYRGVWQQIDHVLYSQAFEGRVETTVVALPWLLEENKTYGGEMPKRTFRGPAYHGGLSDHLPLRTTIAW